MKLCVHDGAWWCESDMKLWFFVSDLMFLFDKYMENWWFWYAYFGNDSVLYGLFVVFCPSTTQTIDALQLNTD